MCIMFKYTILIYFMGLSDVAMNHDLGQCEFFLQTQPKIFFLCIVSLINVGTHTHKCTYSHTAVTNSTF